ncbi:MAG: carboxypeptidase-like regulatory domain-containing protein [Saprospiraceae bacterium]
MPYFPLRVLIPEPCPEDWSAMTAVDDRRRHCAACDRVLTDFTGMTDDRIYRHLRRNEKACGRFLASQLDRDLYPNRTAPTFAKWAAAAAALLLAQPLSAQVSPTLQDPVEISSREWVAAEPTYVPPGRRDSIPVPAQPAMREIRGMVMDSTHGTPIIGGSIWIEGTNNGTVTGIDGHFKLQVSNTAVTNLVISYTGYSSLVTNYDPNGKIDGNMLRFVIAIDQDFDQGPPGVIGYPRPRWLYRITPGFLRRVFW